MLKLKGIQVEEDLSRSAKARRKELEKLLKSIKVIITTCNPLRLLLLHVKTREPDRRCFLTYDRLVVDDNVFMWLN